MKTNKSLSNGHYVEGRDIHHYRANEIKPKREIKMKTIMISIFTGAILLNATSLKACEVWSESDRKTLQALHHKGDTRSIKWFQRNYRAKA